MKIKESDLRKAIRQQLREALDVGQVAGGYDGGSTEAKATVSREEREAMFKAIAAALEKALPGEGVSGPWELEVEVGKTISSARKLSPNLRNINAEKLKNIINSAISAGVREKLKGKFLFFTPNRSLIGTIGSDGVQATKDTDPTGGKDPDPKKPPLDCYKTLKCYPRGDDCVKKQQLAMGLKDDGLWGSDTEKAWIGLGLGARPAKSSDLPACKKGKAPTPTPTPTGQCAKVSAWAWKRLTFVGRQNPRVNPQTYVRLSKANILTQFSESPDVAKVSRSINLTQDLIKQLVECQGTGADRGHSIAANQLIAQLEMNVDVFNDSLFKVLDRALRTGEAQLQSAAQQLWDISGFAGAFGALPQRDAMSPGLIRMADLEPNQVKIIEMIGNKMDAADV